MLANDQLVKMASMTNPDVVHPEYYLDLVRWTEREISETERRATAAGELIAKPPSVRFVAGMAKRYLVQRFQSPGS